MNLDDLRKSLNIPEPSEEEKRDIESVIEARRKMAYAAIRYLPPPLDEKRVTFNIRKMHGDLCELLLLGFVGPAMAYCGPFLEHVLEDAILYERKKRFKRNLTVKEERAVEKGGLGDAISMAAKLALLTPSEAEFFTKFEQRIRHHHQHGSLAALVRGVRLPGVTMVNMTTGQAKAGDQLTEEENRPLRGIAKVAMDSVYALQVFKKIDEILRAVWGRQGR